MLMSTAFTQVIIVLGLCIEQPWQLAQSKEVNI